MTRRLKHPGRPCDARPPWANVIQQQINSAAQQPPVSNTTTPTKEENDK